MFLGLTACACLAPVVLYVSPTGSDQWSGRLAKPNRARTDGPLASIRGAQRRIREKHLSDAVTVEIGSGTYRLDKPIVFGPEHSGANGAARVYRGPEASSGSAKPAILSGMREIKGWRRLPNGHVRALLPEVKAGRWDFIQLFVNGQRRYRPRLPKNGYYTIAEHADPTPESKGKGNDRFRFRPGDLRADWANRDDVDVCAFHEWIMSRNRVKSIEGDRVTFKAPTGTDAPWRDFLKGHRFLVENVKEALKEPGEWYLDKPTGELTYIPMPGESLDKLRIEAPITESLIEFRGDIANRKWVRNITVAGLHLEGTNWTAPKEGRNFPQAEADLQGAVNFSGARSCKFDGNSISHTGAYGIEVGAACKDIILAKNNFQDLGAGGVKIGEMAWQKDPELITEKTQVVANTMRSGGRLHPAAVGVWIGQNPHNHIGGNFIHDFYYTGISVGWSWGYQENGAHHNTIMGNRIGDIGQGVLSDMGGIYTLGPQQGTVIRGNRIHDVQSFSYGGWGIYPDEGSTGILIETNCVFRTKSAGFHQHYGKENVVRNNVFAFGTEHQVMRTRAEEHLSFTFENNIVLWSSGSLLGSNWSGNNYRFDKNVYWRLPTLTHFETRTLGLGAPGLAGVDAASSHLLGEGSDLSPAKPGAPSPNAFFTMRSRTGRKSQGPLPFDFAGMSLEVWRVKGQDLSSVIADPLFADPAKGDFRLRPSSPALKLGFKPFPALDPGNDSEPRQKAPRAWP